MDPAADRAPRPVEVMVRLYLFAFFAFYPLSGALRGGALPKLFVASAIGIAVLDMLVRWARPRVGVAELLFLAFACWYVVASAASPYPALARPTIVTLVGWPVVLLALAQLMCTAGRVTGAAIGYVVGCTAAGAWGIAAVATGAVPTVQVPGQDVNDLGFYTATGCVAAVGIWVARRNPAWLRLLGAGCGFVLAIAVVGSLSRGSIAGTLLGCLVVAVASRDGRIRMFQAAIAAAVIAVASAPIWVAKLQESLKLKNHVAQGNVSSRLDAWGLGVNMGVSNPLAGAGPGSIAPRVMHADHSPPGAFVVAVAHNTFVEALFGTGVLGLLLLVAGVVAVFRSTTATTRGSEGALVRDRRLGAPVLGALAAGVICSLFTTQLYNPTMWVMLALGAAGTAPAWPATARARERVARHRASREPLGGRTADA